MRLKIYTVDCGDDPSEQEKLKIKKFTHVKEKSVSSAYKKIKKQMQKYEKAGIAHIFIWFAILASPH